MLQTLAMTQMIGLVFARTSAVDADDDLDAAKSHLSCSLAAGRRYTTARAHAHIIFVASDICIDQ
jgi:hypothetical protein